MRIKELQGIEILDSRGRPTVKAYCVLENGTLGTASVPSGASTGKAEAVELRDGDNQRYGGLGCKKAVQHINGIINENTTGKNYASQPEFDNELIKLDGTPNKRKLGANAILACSLAFANAMAKEQNLELYQYFGAMVNNHTFQLPRLTVNLFSGGKHAGGQIPVQDLLIVPLSAKTIYESLQDVSRVYQAAIKIIEEEFGMRSLTADEGGLAPSFCSIEEMLDTAIKSIHVSGLEPGKDIFFSMDVAASHFYKDGAYHIGGKRLDSQAMIDRINSWVRKYPIISLEDGLEEDDWQYWPKLKTTVEDKCLVLGDDLFCTQIDRIQKALESDAANALLLKVNQCGSITEAARAYLLAKTSGWQVTISARSGETEDDWLADLAVGWNGDQIKIGSITQSERLAKYNRLLEIESRDRLKLRTWKN